MRREGWQHGMVRNHTVDPPPFNSMPNAKVVNPLGSPPTAGFHTKVTPKPTGHSKYTGKCRKARCMACHSLPVSKSRDKAKGASKLKSCDVALNHRLVSWRVVDNGRWSNYTGISASGILGDLSGDCWDEGGDDNEEQIGYGDEGGHGDLFAGSVDLVVGCGDAEEEEGIGASGVSDGEDGEKMDGFCEVGFVLEYLDGEDWFVVSEM